MFPSMDDHSNVLKLTNQNGRWHGDAQFSWLETMIFHSLWTLFISDLPLQKRKSNFLHAHLKFVPKHS